MQNQGQAPETALAGLIDKLDGAMTAICAIEPVAWYRIQVEDEGATFRLALKLKLQNGKHMVLYFNVFDLVSASVADVLWALLTEFGWRKEGGDG